MASENLEMRLATAAFFYHSGQPQVIRLLRWIQEEFVNDLSLDTSGDDFRAQSEMVAGLAVLVRLSGPISDATRVNHVQ
jgi:hypothetical protein